MSLCTRVLVSPDAKCEQVRRQQRGDEDEEDVGGEDSSLHHLCLPDTEGALRLLRVLKHKLSGERQERESDKEPEIRGAGRGKIEKGKKNKKINRDNENTREKPETAREGAGFGEMETIKNRYLSNRLKVGVWQGK